MKDKEETFSEKSSQMGMKTFWQKMRVKMKEQKKVFIVKKESRRNEG